MLMATDGCGCGSGDDACAVLPPEFVRVRYFYGQRLGVMELNDEAAYHEGKHAFHNARLHGVGVLCGLRAERFVTTPGAATTVLRVSRGAGLDACGREIVVGVDQCIDVAAWLARNRTRPRVAAWLAGTDRRLTVAARYRECPSDPVLAPRDPCGCDNGGCEMGRIREGFELALLTPAETECATAVFPDPAQLASALTGGASSAPATSIAALVAAGCPDPAPSAWLCLATVELVLDANNAATDIGAIDNAPPGRATLLCTAALQSLLLRTAAAAADAGGALSGPAMTGVSFVAGATPTQGTVTVPIALLSSGTPPQPDTLIPGTFDPASVQVFRLDAGGWTDLGVTAALTAAPGAPGIDVPLGAGTVRTGGEIYRLSVDQPLATPAADAKGRPLQPLRFVRQFTFTTDSAGNPQLVPVG
jgi:hypothetical protein